MYGSLLAVIADSSFHITFLVVLYVLVLVGVLVAKRILSLQG